MAPIIKRTFATVMASTAAGLEPSMLISTSNVDRDQDVIEPSGGVFTAYMRNPVVAWQHLREDSMPIGSTLRLDVEPEGIRATWRWLEGDPLADRVRNAYAQGVVRAASIGFMPLAWEPLPSGGRRYTKWELTEWSLCAVPSNREAVRVLRSLDLWRAYDDELVTLPDSDDDGETVVDIIDDDDEPVLEIVDGPDDELVEVDPRELGRALAEVVPQAMAGALRSQVAGAVRGALNYHRGRLDDEVVLVLADDQDALRVKRAERRQQTCDVTWAELEAAVREVVPRILSESVRAEVQRGIRRARGRLD